MTTLAGCCPWAGDSGTDLFARRAPDGTVSFWLRDWSGRPGKTDACTPVPEDFAVRFIRGLHCTGEAVTGLEHDNLVDYLPGLYWAVEKKPGR
jgi:hypothetical protein